MGLYTELFYAIIPAYLLTFCCSAIPTSPYIFFTLVYVGIERTRNINIFFHDTGSLLGQKSTEDIWLIVMNQKVTKWPKSFFFRLASSSVV